jgi:hypothetical protein
MELITTDMVEAAVDRQWLKIVSNAELLQLGKAV